MANVRAESLVRVFDGIRAVDDVSFAVQPGEVFGFLGPNGAGKSTTINMLCTLLSPTSGLAEVAGYDCVKDPDAVRRSIGIIFQESTLDNRLTAHENLLFHAYLYDLDSKTTKTRMDEVLELVGLTDRRNDLVKKFSGGMKRRLEIARGLLHYPKVLFMDEPTIGLDPQTRNMIWEFVRRLKDDTGITLFMTTHYLEEAEFCDRVAIIDVGKIIAEGSPAELKAGLKGDTIRLTTKEPEKLAGELSEKFALDPKKTGDTVTITVQGGAEFIPKMLKGITTPVDSAGMTRPSLNDVFLSITGKDIRDEPPDAFGPYRDFARSRNKIRGR
jgi:ABC-2 type transport system ATP-binding protein